MKSALETVCEGLGRCNAEALLIGGFALPAYDVVRQTVDVDFLVVDAEEHVLREILADAGYEESGRTDVFVRHTHPASALMDVDVLLVDRSTFEKMLKRSSVQRVGSVDVRVPCLGHLVALKLHAIKHNPKRELKDLGDIVALLTENPGEVPRDELHAICTRYGHEGIFAKLESYL